MLNLDNKAARCQKAWEDDSIKDVIGMVSRKYQDRMSPEELAYASKVALLKSLETHDDSKNTMFSTYLYQSMVWQCKKIMSVKSRPRIREQSLDNAIIPNNFYEHTDVGLTMDVRSCLEKLPPEEASVLMDYYVYNYTAQEIADDLGSTLSDTKNLILRSERHFKKLWS